MASVKIKEEEGTPSRGLFSSPGNDDVKDDGSDTPSCESETVDFSKSCGFSTSHLPLDNQKSISPLRLDIPDRTRRVEHNSSTADGESSPRYDGCAQPHEWLAGRSPSLGSEDLAKCGEYTSDMDPIYDSKPIGGCFACVFCTQNIMADRTLH